MIDQPSGRDVGWLGLPAVTIVPSGFFDLLVATLEQPDPAPRLEKAVAHVRSRHRIVIR